MIVKVITKINILLLITARLMLLLPILLIEVSGLHDCIFFVRIEFSSYNAIKSQVFMNWPPS